MYFVGLKGKRKEKRIKLIFEKDIVDKSEGYE